LPISGRRATGGSSIEHEAGAAPRPDQLRLAELPAQVGDVTVDDVLARRPRAAPDPLERELTAHNPARVAQQQLEQFGLAGAQLHLCASPPSDAGAHVEDEVVEREYLLGPHAA